jgi:hypothetical protein
VSTRNLQSGFLRTPPPPPPQPHQGTLDRRESDSSVSRASSDRLTPSRGSGSQYPVGGERMDRSGSQVRSDSEEERTQTIEEYIATSFPARHLGRPVAVERIVDNNDHLMTSRPGPPRRPAPSAPDRTTHLPETQPLATNDVGRQLDNQLAVIGTAIESLEVTHFRGTS